MSNQDDEGLFREVAEEVRQERLSAFLSRYGAYIGAGVLAAVVAAAGFAWQGYQAEQAAIATGSALLSAEREDPEATAQLVETVPGPASAVARLVHAGTLAAEGERERAAEAYRALADDPEVAPAYGELARLHAVRLAAPGLATEEALALVDPLAAEGAPYRLMALELRAALRLNAGDIDGARADLETILADPDRTQGLDARARLLRRATGDAG